METVDLIKDVIVGLLKAVYELATKAGLSEKDIADLREQAKADNAATDERTKKHKAEQEAGLK